MIKLELPSKPDELTDELVQELTDKYLANGSDVWNAKFIRDAVLSISFSKCCYSECKLQEESKYMEVDHFYAKKHFPNDVVKWGNLLPSSKKSNTTKGEHNTLTDPIINPCVDNPKDHLYIVNYRFYPITDIGKTTIDTIALNNRPHFLNKRSKIGHQVSEIINEIYDEISEDTNLINVPRKRNRIVRKFKNLLEESSRENEYSATISTVILTDEYYTLIEQFFIDNNLWDQELVELKNELSFCSLIKRIA